MTKIFFPYNDQPKKFPFKLSEPVRFPFYVNDIVYYWEVGSDGITMYLLNNKIDPDTPIVKDVLIEETGITMYLVNSAADTSKHILIEFAKIGWGMDTLGLLDPFILGEIDPFTLGDISICYANWMQFATSAVKTGANKVIEVSDSEMQLRSDTVLPYTKDIYTGELHEKIGIVGLNNMGHITLGDLDPHTIGDIDAMLSTFRVFSSIPASLVKEIRITQNNSLNNNIVAPVKEFGVSATGIDYYISSVGIAKNSMDISVSATDIDCRISTSESAQSSASVALELTEQYIEMANGTVPLEVTIDDAEQ